jgi:hypothetical protein
MTESSFPVDETDYTGDQFSAIGSAMGNGILDDWGQPYLGTLNDSDQTITIGVSTVSGIARAVICGFGHKIDAPVRLSLPTVTSSTVYHVGWLYDPSKQGNAAGPVSLTVIAGPLNLTSGKVFVALYEVTRTSSAALSASAITRYRPLICPVITLPTYADLINSDPSEFMYGTLAIVSDIGAMFQASGDNLANADWFSLPSSVAQHTNRGTGDIAQKDNFGPSSMVYMTSATIAKAPTGNYMCYGNVKATSSVDNNAAVRMTAQSSSDPSAHSNPVPDSYHRFTSDISDAFRQGPYLHASGDLTVTMFVQMAAGTGSVYANGTYAGAYRIGA